MLKFKKGGKLRYIGSNNSRTTTGKIYKVVGMGKGYRDGPTHPIIIDNRGQRQIINSRFFETVKEVNRKLPAWF